jgi:hypothetical protein
MSSIFIAPIGGFGCGFIRYNYAMTNAEEGAFLRRAVAAVHPTARVEKIVLAFIHTGGDTKKTAEMLRIGRGWVNKALNDLCQQYSRMGYIYEDEARRKS